MHFNIFYVTISNITIYLIHNCLLYTSDAADD